MGGGGDESPSAGSASSSLPRRSSPRRGTIRFFRGWILPSRVQHMTAKRRDPSLHHRPVSSNPSEEGLNRGSRSADQDELSEQPFANHRGPETPTVGRAREQGIRKDDPGPMNLSYRRCRSANWRRRSWTREAGPEWAKAPERSAVDGSGCAKRTRSSPSRHSFSGSRPSRSSAASLRTSSDSSGSRRIRESWRASATPTSWVSRRTT
ncbi:MAG: hypothetical protein QOF89_3037 [Acidobacteriota bacterium]|nr:hypothetical protein [Acidobacteriota bacterium]